MEVRLGGDRPRYERANARGGQAAALAVQDHDPGTKVNSGLVVSGSTLFITTRAGVLYAFVPAPSE